MANTIFKEDFEGEKVAGKTSKLGDFSITDGTGKSVTTGRDNPTKISDFFTISKSNDVLSGDYDYKRIDGKFLASNDLDSIDGVRADATRVMTARNIDISGQKNLEFSIDLAQTQWRFSPTTKITDSWEANTSLVVEVSIDGGGWKQVFGVERGNNGGSPRLDNNLDGVGEGAEITDTFKTYSADIAGGGKSLNLRISHKNSNDKFEDIAIDNIIITGDGGGSTPASPTPTPPPSPSPAPSGEIDLVWGKNTYKGTNGIEKYVVDKVSDSTSARLDVIETFDAQDGDRIDVSQIGSKGQFTLTEKGAGQAWAFTKIEGPGDFELRVNEKLSEVAPGIIYGSGTVNARQINTGGDEFVFDDPKDSTATNLERLRNFDEGDMIDLSALGESDDFSLVARSQNKAWGFVRIDGPDGFRLRVDGDLDEIADAIVYEDTIL